jgi:hypothetical protein
MLPTSFRIIWPRAQATNTKIRRIRSQIDANNA